MIDLIGKSIERYQIIEHLGRGGMAIVYKAYDIRLEREVALKLIRKEAFSPEILDRMLKRFEREAKSLARLSHTHIINIFDYGTYEGAPYLVMEYMPGGTLKDLLGLKISVQKAAGLLRPIAEALAHSHQEGIVHRDIKPSNILIDKNGAPKLTDFGIAQILDSGEGLTLTATGVGVGTPEYMAPEQGLGEKADHRTDIYALGVVLYEMVTGKKPYEADTPMATIIKHINDPLPKPSFSVPGLPLEAEKVIFKAMAKNPEHRYQDMAEFALVLGKIAFSSPGKQEFEGDDELTHDDIALPDEIKLANLKPDRKFLKWTLIGGIAFIVVFVIVGYFLFVLNQPTDPSHVSEISETSPAGL